AVASRGRGRGGRGVRGGVALVKAGEGRAAFALGAAPGARLEIGGGGELGRGPAIFDKLRARGNRRIAVCLTTRPPVIDDVCRYQSRSRADKQRGRRNKQSRTAHGPLPIR